MHAMRRRLLAVEQMDAPLLKSSRVSLEGSKLQQNGPPPAAQAGRGSSYQTTDERGGQKACVISCRAMSTTPAHAMHAAVTQLPGAAHVTHAPAVQDPACRP